MKTAQETLDLLNSASIETSTFKRIFTVDNVGDANLYTAITTDVAILPKDQLIKLTGATDGDIIVIGDGINTYSDCIKMGSDSGGGGGNIPVGTDRQVLSWDEDGNPEAVVLGWREFSDAPTPPQFGSGVLMGTGFQPDGSAMFGFKQVGVDDDTAEIIPIAKAIPLYTDDLTLKVGDAVEDDDAVSLGQLNTKVPSGGTNTTFLRGDGTWVTPTNTTYTAIAEAEASTGTATTVRAISAQSLKRDILNRTARFDSITEVNADRTLLLTDASKNKLISLTGGNTVTLTIPPSSSVAWVTGDVVKFSNTHAAKLSFVAGLGVNISSVDDFLAVSPKGWAELRYLGANSWHLIGTLYTGE